MREATARFFADLGSRGFEPLLEKFTGTVRFDFYDDTCTEHRMVVIDRGRIQVADDGRQIDAVIGANSELFEQIMLGRDNAVAALLRGAMVVTGDLLLVLGLERLFPAAPETRGPRRVLIGEVR